MANYQLLKADIDEKVYENAQQKINGANLNAVLNAMVSTLGAEYQFAGVATTATNPDSPDAKVFYIANGKGTYTNFGGLEVTEDDVVVLYYDTEWHKEATGIASQAKLTELGQKTSLESSALEFDFDVEVSKGAGNAQQFDNLNLPSGYYEYCLKNITSNNSGSFGIYFFDKNGNAISSSVVAYNEIGVSRTLYLSTDIARINIGDIGASITTDGKMEFSFKFIASNLAKIERLENSFYNNKLKGVFINGVFDASNQFSSYGFAKRATLIEPISYDNDIVISAKSGYVFSYVQFNADGTPSGIATGWVDNYKITKNTKFKINIDKSSVGIDDAVSVDELVNSLSIDIIPNTIQNASFIGNGSEFSNGEQMGVRPNSLICIEVDTDVDMSGVPVIGNSRFNIAVMKNDVAVYALMNIYVTQELKPKYYLFIPDGVSQLRIGGRCASGVEFKATYYEPTAVSILEDFNNYLLFYQGVTNSSGEIVDTAYRIVSWGIYYAVTDLRISVDDGYQFAIVQYDSSGNFISGTPWMVDDTTIQKGTYYRLLLAKTEYVTIPATDSSHIHIIPCLNRVIDKKQDDTISTIKYNIKGQRNIESIARLGYDIAQSYTPPENSIAGFNEAYKHNYRSMLANVRWTADGVPVCLHDETINAVARNADGTTISEDVRLDSLTLAEVDEYDFGIIKGEDYAGLKIMRLDEFVRWCKLMNVKPYLEVKDFEHKGVNGTLSSEEWGSITSIIDKYGMQNKVAFVLDQPDGQSLAAATLVHQTYPKSDICAHRITGNWDTDCATWATLKNEYNDIFWYIYDETVMTGKIPNDLISAANANGLSIGYTEIHNATQLNTWLTDANNLICTRVAIRIKPFEEYMFEKMLN